MPSFDIVSEVDLVELKNAIDNSNRELETRFDFRGVDASFSFTKESAKLTSGSDFQLQQLRDILRKNLVKRGVDTRSLEFEKSVQGARTYSQNIKFKQGVEASVAKKLVKIIKEQKVKVQVSIQGEQLRVTGKKRDDLQAAMRVVKESDLEQPFQFDNFRD